MAKPFIEAEAIEAGTYLAGLRQTRKTEDSPPDLQIKGIRSQRGIGLRFIVQTADDQFEVRERLQGMGFASAQGDVVMEEEETEQGIRQRRVLSVVIPELSVEGADRLQALGVLNEQEGKAFRQKLATAQEKK